MCFQNTMTAMIGLDAHHDGLPRRQGGSDGAGRGGHRRFHVSSSSYAPSQRQVGPRGCVGNSLTLPLDELKRLGHWYVNVVEICG